MLHGIEFREILRNAFLEAANIEETNFQKKEKKIEETKVNKQL